MAVQVSITTTARQDARLAKMLAAVNADRVASGQAPFADVNDMSKEFLKNVLISWVRNTDSEDGQAVGSAYQDATDAVQAQVKSLLGLS